MKNTIKKYISVEKREKLLQRWARVNAKILKMVVRSNLLVLLYYFLFSRSFLEENKSVLSGRIEYWDDLRSINVSSPLLRRNVHRLEKALIMRPRRANFGMSYIEETINIFIKAVKKKQFNTDELRWAQEVLEEYFEANTLNKTLKNLREKFDRAKISLNESTDKYIPYHSTDRTKTSVDINELSRLFKRRRSVRWFGEKSVQMTDIKLAMDAALQAPSACNRQPFSVYVPENKEKTFEIATCVAGTRGWAENIPCCIAVVGDLSAYPKDRDRHLIYIDSSLMAMQFMLALEALGLSSCPINWPDVPVNHRKIADVLNLKDHQRVIMLMAIGYAEETGGIPFSQKRSAEEVVKYA